MKFGGMIMNYESGEVMMYFKTLKPRKTPVRTAGCQLKT
jgi:hypothetical protein